MKKLKSSWAAALLLVAIVSVPFVSLADNAGKMEKENKIKIEQRIENKSLAKSNSIFNRILNWFNAKPSATNAILNSSLSTNVSLTPSTWNVKASDPQNGSLSYAVDWGDVSLKPLARVNQEPVFVQTSTFTHAYANPGKYTVKFSVSNTAGLSTASSVTVHITGTSVQPIVISNASAVSKDATHATLKWNTDVRGTSLVWYGTASPVNTSLNPNVSHPAKVYKHKINLNKLQPNTTYYVIVGSANKANVNPVLSAEMSFITPVKADSATPVITSLSGPSTILVGATETVTVNAYDPKNSSLSYSANWGDNQQITSSISGPIFVQTATFSHIYSVAGIYTATFVAENSAGKSTSASMSITVTAPVADTTPPVISPHDNITIEATSSAGAVVTYTAPEVNDNVDPKTSATCLPASGSTFPMGETKVLCNATDASGNKAVETSFIVKVVDTTKPVISNTQAVLGSTSVTVSWTTNEPANSEVFYALTTPVDVNLAATLRVVDNNLVTNHSVVVPSLTANTLYHFIIESNDGANNTALSAESSFTTSL